MQTMIIGSNSSFVHRQSGNPVGLCDAKHSQTERSHSIHMHIHTTTHTHTRAAVRQVQEELTGERCRSVANFSANGKKRRNVI